MGSGLFLSPFGQKFVKAVHLILKATVTTLFPHGLISSLYPAWRSLTENRPSAKQRSWLLLSPAQQGLGPQVCWQLPLWITAHMPPWAFFRHTHCPTHRPRDGPSQLLAGPVKSGMCGLANATLGVNRYAKVRVHPMEERQVKDCRTGPTWRYELELTVKILIHANMWDEPLHPWQNMKLWVHKLEEETREMCRRKHDHLNQNLGRQAHTVSSWSSREWLWSIYSWAPSTSITYQSGYHGDGTLLFEHQSSHLQGGNNNPFQMAEMNKLYEISKLSAWHSVEIQ